MKMFFKTITLAMITTLLHIPAHAAASNIYIAASSAGAADGSSCANSRATSFFNTAGNWGGGGSQIGAGTTVHLCGTISTSTVGATILTFHGSGTSGNPITLKWEAGAVVQAVAGGALINGNSNSYLVFDGNSTSPSITETANGSGLAYQLDGAAIDVSSCTGCELENLTITNIFAHLQNADTGGRGNGNCIYANNGSGLLIHNNSIDQCYVGINLVTTGITPTQDQIYSNTIDHINWGVYFNNGGSTTIPGPLVHDNTIVNMNNWDDNVNDSYHHDGLFVVNNGTGYIQNTMLYNNSFTGTMSNCVNSCATAWIFFNTGITNLSIFNNVLLNGGGPMVEGCIAAGRAPQALDSGINITNNTFITTYGLYNITGCNGLAIENNIYGGSIGGSALYISQITGTYAMDYNVYQNFSSGEPHSLNVSSLMLDGSYHPSAGSPVIGKGTNLTSLGIGQLDLDKAGVIRSTAWDVGAYQYSTGAVAPLPPTNLSATVH